MEDIIFIGGKINECLLFQRIKMKKHILFLIVFFSLTLYSFAAPLNLNQITEASVRVNVPGAAGSGTVYHQDDTYYYVLTNAHVVGSARSATCEFFSGGLKSSKIPAEVMWRQYSDQTDVDFAVMRIIKTNLKNHVPRVIPLLPPSYSFTGTEYIQSVGCPEARWAQGFEGRLLGNNGSRVLFTPPPKSGQSGSGIHINIEVNGESYTFLAAVLTWQIGYGGRDERGFDLAQGGAIPIHTLRKILGGERYQPIRVPEHYRTVAYALGSDGKHYQIHRNPGGFPFVDLPNHVTIIDWEHS